MAPWMLARYGDASIGTIWQEKNTCGIVEKAILNISRADEIFGVKMPWRNARLRENMWRTRVSKQSVIPLSPYRTSTVPCQWVPRAITTIKTFQIFKRRGTVKYSFVSGELLRVPFTSEPMSDTRVARIETLFIISFSGDWNIPSAFKILDQALDGFALFNTCTFNRDITTASISVSATTEQPGCGKPRWRTQDTAGRGRYIIFLKMCRIDCYIRNISAYNGRLANISRENKYPSRDLGRHL